MTDSRSGYTYKFEVYTGKRQGEDQIAGDLGVTGLLVARLVSGMEYQGHVLYTDKFYTSVPLALYLNGRGIDLCGTIRVSRKHLPEAVVAEGKRLKNCGEFLHASFENLLFMIWKDRKPVSLLSSIHKAKLGAQIERNTRDKERGHRKIKVDFPVLLHDYNEKMGGVDKNDQMTRMRKDQKQLNGTCKLL